MNKKAWLLVLLFPILLAGSTTIIIKKTSSSNASSSNVSLSQGTGILLSPNPITGTGNVSIDTGYFTTSYIQWANESVLNVNNSAWLGGRLAAHYINTSGTIPDSNISSSATWNAKENALTFTNGLSRTVNTISLLNATAATIGGIRALTCSGTDKISSIGTNGLPVCSSDAGGGTSFAAYNVTIVNVSSTSNTVWTNVLNLTLASSGRSMIDCDLYTISSAAATGIRLNVTVTGSSRQTYMIDYYTSTTAKAVCASPSAAASVSCLPGTSAGVLTPTYLDAYSVRSAVGHFSLWIQSETGNQVNMTEGSWCRAIETS